jgi:hypothetical protein
MNQTPRTSPGILASGASRVPQTNQNSVDDNAETAIPAPSFDPRLRRPGPPCRRATAWLR